MEECIAKNFRWFISWPKSGLSWQIPQDLHSWKGNFFEAIELLGQFDDITKEHLRRSTSKETSVHYLGPTIQNEIISVLKKLILQNIIDRLLVAKYYGMIVDWTPDENHQEQMSMIFDSSTLLKLLQVFRPK